MISNAEQAPPSKEEIELFQRLVDENRYCFEELVYIIFPFGQAGTELEEMAPYDWQIEEWRKLSAHLSNPATRYTTYRLAVSSGNGAAKTAFVAMTLIMILYTQRLRSRVTANTDPQLKQVIWPEWDLWFHRARFSNFFFEKFGTSIKAKNKGLSSTWRIDTFTWSEESPTAISGLHNKGGAVAYVFEEAPGIPANIFNYASGAFTETGTIKLWFAMGNSDDPESKFEQLFDDPTWNSRRIDTRTLDHIDKSQIADWLKQCGGNEDHDDFRVRVRGLPRKASKDAIISREIVDAAFERGRTFDDSKVSGLPVVLTCDPAWTGGDLTTIWVHLGYLHILVDAYTLDKTVNQTHQFTYSKLSNFEREYRADAVFIDQGEGTGIYTLAQNDGKFTWELVSFGAAANDAPTAVESEYANMRAKMYYETEKQLPGGHVIQIHTSPS